MTIRLAALWVGAFAALSSFAGAQDLWIEDVAIVSPERSQPLKRATVRIHEERIAEVSQRSVKGKHRAAIDGKGLFLVPGLIDSHVHLYSVTGMLPEQEQAHPDIARTAREQFPKSYLYFGFTTLVDLISTPQEIAVWNAHAIRPDTYFCGGAPVADGYPMSFLPQPIRYQLMPYFLVEPKSEAAAPAGADAAAHAPAAIAARMKADGAICVKTFFERGFGASHDLPVPQLETIRALVQAAHAVGLPVLLHANSSEAQAFGLDAGVDIFAHGLWNWSEPAAGADLTPEVTRILRGVLDGKHGWQPTIQVLYGIRNLFDDAFLSDPMLAKAVPASLIEWYKSKEGQWFHDQIASEIGAESKLEPEKVVAVAIARVSHAVAFLAGQNGRILFGSDTPSAPTFANPPGLNGWLEMHRLIDSGMTPAQVFKAATLSNAAAFGLNREIGTVEVGKRANLLLLHEDPTQTIHAYDRIEKVILRGRVLDRAELAADAAPAR
ncbi:MAG TPA: amidohydrolase family protein [Steroidobacteraceae bacterium]|nr:amidohydrolase family protein [Steroidobacteraceae bacterium]